jgi:thiol-disulfide isomerase/thioredoxin
MSVYLTRQDFLKLLETNPGRLIFKFGAGWCGPCKMIMPQCEHFMRQLPRDKYVFVPIDVDDSFEVYSLLRAKKMVQSVPTLLCYKKGNTNPIAPDYVVVGASVEQVNYFFQQCTADMEL